jgi:hypothetical protein
MGSALEDNPHHYRAPLLMAPLIHLVNPMAYLGLHRPLLVLQDNHFQEAWLAAHRLVPSNVFRTDRSRFGLLPWPHLPKHKAILHSLRRARWPNLAALPT